MRIQLVSDLHLENLDNDDINLDDFVQPVADILILAGDIGSLYRNAQLENFINKVCSKFKVVIYVPGNHEYYFKKTYLIPKTIYELRKDLYSMLKKFSNLYILDRSCITIGDIVIAGCTFWSDIGDNFFPKFRVRIHNLLPKTFKYYHERDIAFIKAVKHESERNNKKLIIVSHYAPSKLLLNPMHDNDPFNYLYASNTDYLVENGISCWLYGHTHYNKDVFLGNCRVVSNQYGRIKDNIRDFRKDFSIEV
jgi:hypothetical protein